MAASTSTPMEIAIPDRDMMFEDMPSCRIRMNEINAPAAA